MRRSPDVSAAPAPSPGHPLSLLWPLALLLAVPFTVCSPDVRDTADAADESPLTRGVEVAERDATEARVGGRDYALLIATDTYDHWKKLPNPISDIRAIGQELHDVYGFHVDYLEGPTRREIREKLREYATRRTFSPQDQLLIFIAGHGFFDKLTKTGYLVARDTKSREEDFAFDSFLPYPSTLRLIDKIPAPHILLMADACFAGTLDPRIASRGEDIHAFASNAAYLRRKLELRTRRYVTSGGKEYVPDGRPGHHSPFARAMLGGLRSFGGSDGILSLDELIAGHLEGVSPLPRWSDFGDNEPGSTFLFVVKSRRIAPDDSALPLDFKNAAAYCDAGGPRNVEKGVQLFRGLLEEIPPAERSELDSTTLTRADDEYLKGSAQKTCSLYKALFSAFFSDRTDRN